MAEVKSKPPHYMVMDYLSGIVSFSISVKLAKVIDQWSHAGGEVYDTVYQFSQWQLPYWRIFRCDEMPENCLAYIILISPNFCLVSVSLT